MKTLRILKKEYYEHLYTHKYDNLEKWISSLKDATNLAYVINRLSEYCLLKNWINSNNFPKQEAPDPDGFTGEFY